MKLLHALRPCLLLLTALAGADVRADLIARTITVDGNFSDWDGSTGSYNPAGDILNNATQYNTDCQSGTACERDGSLSSTGRDLRKFAFTWDNTNLYFYLERWDNSNNVTDWWFYMDTNGDLKMNSGEKVMRVKWSGSNRSTTVSIWTYTAVLNGGDSIKGGTGFADGYTMPGSISGETALYSSTSGGNSGLQMEAYLPWSTLGSSGPTNMGFHIASGNGSNVPSNIVDNMDGPNGNQLFPSDIKVEKTVSASTTAAGNTFSYTVTVRNLGYSSISNLVVRDILPANSLYQSHSASTGTFSDSDGNSVPDLWSIASIAGQAGVTLTITVTAANVTSPATDSNTATLTSWVGENFYTGNDSASASVLINPGPLLTTTKTSSSATTSPGQTLRYRVYISNIGYSVATNVVAIDQPSPFTAFRLNTFGSGLNVRYSNGSPASGLTLGTVQYSSNNGSTYTYTPVSGGGGAPADYDANITNIRISMSGSMNGNGANFLLEYDAILR